MSSSCCLHCTCTCMIYMYIACRVRMCQYTVATYVSLTKERRIKQTKKEIADIIIMQLLCL